MRGKPSPWTDLQLAVRSHLNGQYSLAAVHEAACACFFLKPEGDSTAYALALNALKSMCMAWRDAPDQESYRNAVRHLMQVIDTWPHGIRAATYPVRRETTAVNYKPYWMDRD